MRFGDYLAQEAGSWGDRALDYKTLKALVSAEAADEARGEAGRDGAGGAASGPRVASLTVRVAGGSDDGEGGARTRFYAALDAELDKIGAVTADAVLAIRRRLRDLSARVEARLARLARQGEGGGAGVAGAGDRSSDDAELRRLRDEATAVGDDFLDVERYVNLNYLGEQEEGRSRWRSVPSAPPPPVSPPRPHPHFSPARLLIVVAGVHKILKKHDKCVPELPVRAVYLARLHRAPWVQGNYSDVLVHLSRVHALLRGDSDGARDGADADAARRAAAASSAQGFVRSTTKFWVRSGDVSTVKHFILRHLPVFTFPRDGPGSGDGDGGPNATPDDSTSADCCDAQLVSSVYLDNATQELYHARLDKNPGALAVRLRWYGAGPPRDVFVERKTHREGWKGETSVKERFVLPEARVVPFLRGELDGAEEVERLREAGRSADECSRFETLFREIQGAVKAKLLVPTVRTQYMRSAYQIPFDARVRISLDSNLCMIREEAADAEVPTLLERGRWRRSADEPPRRAEVTRFPHVILEVKLALPAGETAPSWVEELVSSGYLVEVHKARHFSFLPPPPPSLPPPQPRSTRHPPHQTTPSSRNSSTVRRLSCPTRCGRCPTGWTTSLFALPCCSRRRWRRRRRALGRGRPGRR